MRFLTVFWMVAAAGAEVHTLTLREAAALAAARNPDVLIAAIDEQRAAQQVQVARDPFIPKFYAGSGLAYSYGFPMSIEGSAPSIVQARGVASVLNMPQRYQLRQARQDQATAQIDTEAKREQALVLTVDAFLRAEQAGRAARAAVTQVDAARRLSELVKARVEAGRELEIEARRAALEVARAEQAREDRAADADYSEAALASILGFPAGDRARPDAGADRVALQQPESLEAAVDQAAKHNTDIRRLESDLVAKGFAVKAARSERLPQFDLVAQYALFGRFNNYEDFFNKFQRQNAQLGVSVKVPLFTGPATAARIEQASGEEARLRLQIQAARNRVRLETERRYAAVARADRLRDLRRQELDFAREALSLQLTLFEEGRVLIDKVEQARLEEQVRWSAYYEAQHGAEIARFSLLEQTGGLMAALR